MGELVDSESEWIVILYDGMCNLCSGVVQFLLPRDRFHKFRFASLQSNYAANALAEFCRMRDLPDSVIVLHRGKLYEKSDAVIYIASALGRPWSFCAILRIVPRRLRDTLYDWIAKRRTRWFGTRTACLIPSPEYRRRFID